MHSYSLDTEIRRKAYVSLALIALAVPTFVEKARVLLGLPENFGFPVTFGVLFGALFWFFDNWCWRFRAGPISMADLLGIPDLNGTWLAQGVSSYPDPQTGQPTRFEMTVIIKQTFSRIDVHTETAQSTSRSTMAAVETQRAVATFRYAFENQPKNMADAELQRHPGLIELRVNKDGTLTGDYFSGKHRLRYGELTLERKK
jgi:hypothetical protein